LKDAHANEIDILGREISKLHKFLDSRNEEIENISKERNQMRQALEAEILKTKASL
jgi:prefoldin subunit 5